MEIAFPLLVGLVILALLFDFLLKRRVNIRGDYFGAAVFQTRPFFQNING